MIKAYITADDDFPNTDIEYLSTLPKYIDFSGGMRWDADTDSYSLRRFISNVPFTYKSTILDLSDSLINKKLPLRVDTSGQMINESIALIDLGADKLHSYNNNYLTLFPTDFCTDKVNLKTITGLKCKKVSTNAISNCQNLTHISLPRLEILADESITNNIALREICLSKAITSLGSKVFNGCTALTSIAFRNDTDIPAIMPDTFEGTPIAEGEGYIHVRSDMLSQFKTAPVFSNYTNQIYPIIGYHIEGNGTVEEGEYSNTDQSY